MGNKGNRGNKGNHQSNHNSQPIIDYSEMYKITFDGFIGVGKTSLIKKYLEGKVFNESKESYAARRYFIYTFGFLFEGRNIGVQIFDCSTNGNFLGAAAYVCRRTDVFIFIYDISVNQVLLQLKKICHHIKINLRKKML